MPIDALSVLCAQLTRDLLAIAKFLFALDICELHKSSNYMIYKNGLERQQNLYNIPMVLGRLNNSFSVFE